MRVVIDTNIIVSAILRDRAPEQVLQFLIDSPEWEWIASSPIVAEYVGVLSRPKFKLPETVIQAWRDLFISAITIVETADEIEFPRDPKDAKFLTCIIQCGADYFITGDRDFESAPANFSAVIVSVGQFQQQFLTER
jgi:uncharacterized protein